MESAIEKTSQTINRRPAPDDQSYFITGAKTLNALGLACIELCEQGWKPLGGPGFIPPGSGTDADGMFYQAFCSSPRGPITRPVFDEFPDAIDMA